MTLRTDNDRDFDLLRHQLSEALVQADRCDPMIAIHVETALALLDERYGPAGQSNAR